MVDWKKVRSEFPATRERAYLNTATYGPGPERVVQAVETCLERWSTGEGSWAEWEAAGEDCRRDFATLLGAGPETIALLPTVSAAVGQVATTLPRPEVGSRNLVVGGGEFRSLIYPWLAQEQRGYEVRVVPFRDGALHAHDLAAAIDVDTAVVAASHVQSSNGYLLDTEPVVRACLSTGARFFLDATQSAGALRIDLDGVDYLAVTGYKWLVSPRGSAFLYVAPERIGSMPPAAPGWKTPGDPYAEYYGPPLDLAPDASRFDQSLAWPVWAGTAAALELLLELGIDAIEARDRELAQRFCAGLPAIGLAPLFPPERTSQVVGLAVPDPEAVRRALEAAGVVAAVRGQYLRVSFHFYNNEDDVDRALAALA